MTGGFGDVAFGCNDKNSALGADDVDRRAVEGAERFAGDDVVHRADGRAAARDVEDPIHGAEEGIDVVRDEEDRRSGGGLDAPDAFDEAHLVAGVEAGEGFVEDEEARSAEQGLGEGDALLFAAGEDRKRSVGIPGGTGQFDCVGDFVAGGPVLPRDPPAVAARDGRDERAGAERGAFEAGAALGHVADGGVGPAAGGLTVNRDPPRAERRESEQTAHEGGFAGAVGSKYADEFAGVDAGVDAVQDVASPQAHPGLFDGEGSGQLPSPRAASTSLSSASIQST